MVMAVVERVARRALVAVAALCVAGAAAAQSFPAYVACRIPASRRGTSTNGFEAGTVGFLNDDASPDLVLIDAAQVVVEESLGALEVSFAADAEELGDGAADLFHGLVDRAFAGLDEGGAGAVAADEPADVGDLAEGAEAAAAVTERLRSENAALKQELSDLRARFAEGEYDAGGRRLYVTRGVGTSMLPFRAFCRPEVVVFTVDAG
jgi:hypothetical protein